MAKYTAYIHYSTCVQVEVEAESEAEAVLIGREKVESRFPSLAKGEAKDTLVELIDNLREYREADMAEEIEADECGAAARYLGYERSCPYCTVTADTEQELLNHIARMHEED